MLINYRELRKFLNSKVLPDQWGGQFPPIKIVDGNSPPHIALEKRDGKKDKRVLVVGEAWIVDQAINDIMSLRSSYD